MRRRMEIETAKKKRNKDKLNGIFGYFEVRSMQRVQNNENGQ